MAACGTNTACGPFLFDPQKACKCTFSIEKVTKLCPFWILNKIIFLFKKKWYRAGIQGFFGLVQLLVGLHLIEKAPKNHTAAKVAKSELYIEQNTLLVNIFIKGWILEREQMCWATKGAQSIK